MKKIILLFLLIFSSCIYAQNYQTDWNNVLKDEVEGEIASANTLVLDIYKNAMKTNNEPQIIKCFFYISKFKQVLSKNAQSEIIKSINSEIKKSSPDGKALLNYIYAELILNYFEKNSHQIRNRTTVINKTSDNFLDWTSSDFIQQIDLAYEKSLENKEVLRTTSLKKYAELFKISDEKNFDGKNLYDFLLEKNLDHFQSLSQYKIINIKENQAEIINKLPETYAYFKTIDTAAFADKNTRTLILLYQDGEKYYTDLNDVKASYLYYDRLQKFKSLLSDKLYYEKIKNLENTTKDLDFKQILKIERAENYVKTALKSKNKNYDKALVLCDSIENSKINRTAQMKAANIKSQILEKTITLDLETILYPNQNSKARVTFKNIDSIKISYFKIPLKNNYFFTRNNKINIDSLVRNYVTSHKSVISFKRKLPNKGDYFQYTTDVLLDKLDVGNYMIYIETIDETSKKNPIFSFQNITVTNLSFVTENENKNDPFYVTDRKTGKPIANVKIQNGKEIVKTNSSGKAVLPKRIYNKKNVDNELFYFTKDNDTLVQYQYRNYASTNDNEEEVFDAKAMVFFDRAIYRPGQKMFYKGIIIQSKNFVKSVVPLLTVHVSIEDANYNTVKEFDVQTNEFGSFSGEFLIPRNILTGEFTFSIEEPSDTSIDTKYYNKKEDVNTFWDNVNDAFREFNFQVEEYKRPTFEIKFDTIKENYSIGDFITISGNAKALAGNNITRAKLKYTISKGGSQENGLWIENDSIASKEVMTDDKGNFKIQFKAEHLNYKQDSIADLNYSIKADVTDINGETRTASSSIIVGKKTLKLDLNLINTQFIENKNFVTISATTLNDFPIDTKGEIKIYKTSERNCLLESKFGVPEINTIPKEDYIKLFPYEPYYDNYETGVDSEKVLVKTISFDTKIESKIPLDFLKNEKLGSYTIVASAIDSRGNSIETTNNLFLNSLNNPNLESSLLITKDISKKSSDYYEIEIKSSIPDLFIFSRYYESETNKANEIIKLKNGVGIFKIKKNKKQQNDINFQFFTTWENTKFEKKYSIEKEDNQSKLEFETLTFRNKIEPGSEEKWSFKIYNSKLESEVLATMYDSSLDQFTRNNNTWKSLYFRQNSYKNNFINYDSYETNISKMYFVNYALRISKYNITTPNELEMNWFGFNFAPNQYDNSNQEYLKYAQMQLSFGANKREINGLIRDKSGPIPNANIVIKGTQISSQANIDGEFSILAKTGDILIFSSVGYLEKEVLVVDSGQIEILLEEGLSLNEVVINVMGVKRMPKELAYAAKEVVSNKELIQAAQINGVTALAGRVSGLNVRTQNNGINPSTEIILRGYKSLTGNNDSLIVVDGVIVAKSFLDTLKPESIVSIIVLKSNDATLLYGSEGANGALVITTKNSIKEVTNIKTRRNFNETAFFYPDLKTDSEGKITFSFTTPESLTKWKLRMHAINKKAETGYLETSIISQKEVMIVPNIPRFVREKDSITISAKLVNMTNEVKSGTALLLLYDAVSLKSTDTLTLNTENLKYFICKPNESTALYWKISIPDGLQALQYKILAKSASFSDGEENIIPVLTNKILIAESIPLWVRENSTKKVVFENLKNNQSKTLKNHLITLEYTSNPIWLAIQSLPYLMEYEHECAEQTFARYYANCIATEIISSNPKIEALFKSWNESGNLKSKLEMNSELKSIIETETPWFLDADEEAKNKRLAVLFDLNSLNISTETTFEKLKDKLLPSGGFPWFDGGSENDYITQHILSGIGHLTKLFPKSAEKYKAIVEKGIPNIDAKFLANCKVKREKTLHYNYNDIQYLYARSFYLQKFPVSAEVNRQIIKQIEDIKKNWLNYSLYHKAQLALIMNRYNENSFAEKIITHFKETTVQNSDDGMYWLANKNGCYWYQSSIETQALLIEAFSEIGNNKKEVDEMKVWLIKNKQTSSWPTTKATTEAIYALLLTGSNWKSIKENTVFKIGDTKILSKKLSENEKEVATGYIKMSWKENEITKEMATISVENKSEVPGFGGVYWQYFEELQNIKSNTTTDLSIKKELFKKVTASDGNKLIAIANEKLQIGDLVTVRLIIKTDNDLEFVHLKDLRASCFEPINVISEYKWNELKYYMSTKDAATHFFFDAIKRGTYVLEYDVRVTNLGSFNNGIATIQSMYAPEFTTHSVSDVVKVKE